MCNDSSTSNASDQRQESIDVRGYAEIAAWLRWAPMGESAQVLARHGLAESEWRDLAAKWEGAIAEEIARGGHDLLLAYAETFQATRNEITETVPIVAGPETIEEAALPPAEEAFEPPVPVLATFQLAPAVPVPVTEPAAPPTAIDEAAERRAILAAFSTVQSVASFEHQGTAQSLGKGRVGDFGETADADLQQAVKTALPFIRPTPPSASAMGSLGVVPGATGGVPRPRPPKEFTGTTAANLSVAMRPAMPFVASPVPSGVPGVVVAPRELAETTAANLQEVIKEALPFRAALAEPSASAPSTPRPPSSRKPSGTQPMAAAPALLSPLPFARTTPASPTPAEGSVPVLTVDQYATLCVEIAVIGTVTEEMRGFYGIASDRVVIDLHAAWQRRFAADAELAQSWEALCAKYHAVATRPLC